MSSAPADPPDTYSGPQPGDLVRRWRETWRALDREAPRELLEDLLARYAESHRSYHGLDHVRDCLEKAETSRAIQNEPPEVDLALWYHDAIYDPRWEDNEERSAALADTDLSALLTLERIDAIRSSILDTRHEVEPTAPDGAVVVDIDRSILGADPEAYDEYRNAIREEYRWVPESLFRRERCRLLRSFLARRRIFVTRHFRRRFETRARMNLERELALLEGSPGPSGGGV